MSTPTWTGVNEVPQKDAVAFNVEREQLAGKKTPVALVVNFAEPVGGILPDEAISLTSAVQVVGDDVVVGPTPTALGLHVTLMLVGSTACV